MFTGIVQALAPVTSASIEKGVLKLVVQLGNLTGGLQAGASVAVNGTCLTVTRIGGESVHFDVIEETRRLTNLGDLAAGHLVNIERSFRAGDEIGGHIVSGHVTSTAEVTVIDSADGIRNMTLTTSSAVMKYLLHKGFVALDGASLTVAWVDYAGARFGVCLIPETIERTTLGRVRVGERVNVEPDSQTQTIVHTVERVLATEDLLVRLRGRS